MLEKVFYTSVLVSDQDKALDFYTTPPSVDHDRDRRLPDDGRGAEVARGRVRLGRARVPVGLRRAVQGPRRQPATGTTGALVPSTDGQREDPGLPGPPVVGRAIRSPGG
jgi:hypothetical protein